jgi:hypothetical protein
VIRRLLASFYLLVLVTANGVSAQTPSASQELRELTDFYERRVRQGVQDFLGPQARAVVNVYIKGRAVAPGEPATSVDQVLKEDGRATTLLVGPYFPAVSELRASGVAVENEFRIEAAEVSIQVDSSLKPELREQLSAVVKATLREVPSTVTVEATLQANTLAEEATSAGRAPASIEVSGDAWTRFAERFGIFVPLVSTLILLLGVFAISSGMRSAAHEISEGIKTVRPVSNPTSLPTAVNRPALPSPAERTRGSGDDNTGSRSQGGASPFELRRNVQILERYLRESPNLLLRSFGEAPEDILGLSYLISRMSAASNALLKDHLGVDRIAKLSSFRTSSEVIGFDVNGWVQSLVERVELKRLAGGDVIEESMTPDQTALLSNVGQEQLLRAAMRSDEPAVWRVVSEFVSSDFLRREGHTSDDQVWMGLVRGARVTDPSVVKVAVEKLVDELRSAASENAVQLREKNESREHFLRKILPMLVDTVFEREFGEDDRIVQHLLAETPDFEKLVYERIWTPKRLDIVTDVSLKTFLLGPSFDNERRAYLIYALPEAQARRIEGLLPDGTMKKIVLDIASRLRTTADRDKKDGIRNWVRQFLDAVRVEVAGGRLETKESSRSAARSVSPDEVVEVADADQLKAS